MRFPSRTPAALCSSRFQIAAFDHFQISAIALAEPKIVFCPGNGGKTSKALTREISCRFSFTPAILRKALSKPLACTSFFLPQSHGQSHLTLLLPDPSPDGTVRRSNRCPVRSTDATPLPHPQPLVLPLQRFKPETVFCFPQSHWQSHVICPCLFFPARDRSVRRPKCRPIRSDKYAILLFLYYYGLANKPDAAALFLQHLNHEDQYFLCIRREF